MITRFFLTCGKHSPDIILHAVADLYAERDGRQGHDSSLEKFAQELLQHYFFDFIPRQLKPALITGHDLIHGLGLTPSPLFKTILDRVTEQIMMGEITTKDEGIQWIRKFLSTYS
jgi:hypothetical protein